MTYNILADKHCSRQTFPWACSGALIWERRYNAITDLIREHYPDILCLQEVELEKVDMLTSTLINLGYSGYYAARMPTHDANELGILICHRSDKYRKLYSTNIKLNDLKDMCSPEHQKKYDKNHTVAVVVLESVNLATPPIVVASPHISANHLQKEVQMMQICHMFKILKTLIKTLRIERTITECPALVIAGDFNAVPGSEMHTLITTGKISETEYTNEPYPKPSHSFLNLGSAYKDCFGSEPDFTTFTRQRLFPGSYSFNGFQGTLDYILYSRGLMKVVSCLEPIPQNVAELEGAWPSVHEPSDHMALVSDFEFICS